MVEPFSLLGQAHVQSIVAPFPVVHVPMGVDVWLFVMQLPIPLQARPLKIPSPTMQAKYFSGWSTVSHKLRIARFSGVNLIVKEIPLNFKGEVGISSFPNV
jgi:hypothetical protein